MSMETGLPKGINNNHLKLCLVGAAVSGNMGMGEDAVGYACMPLFHSNAMYLGFHRSMSGAAAPFPSA